jgi:hypothetical protein
VKTAPDDLSLAESIATPDERFRFGCRSWRLRRRFLNICLEMEKEVLDDLPVAGHLPIVRAFVIWLVFLFGHEEKIGERRDLFLRQGVRHVPRRRFLLDAAAGLFFRYRGA